MTAPATTKQAPTTTSGPTAGAAPSWVGGLKEATTTFIALVVLVVAMGMLVMMFLTGASWNDQKDIMLYALPILGSVIGYYFGRVPAERRAEAAEESRGKAEDAAGKASDAAREAQRQAQESATKVARAKDAIERARSKLQSGAAVSGSGAPDPFLEVLDGISREL